MNIKIQTFIIVLIFTNNFIASMEQQEQTQAAEPAPLQHSIQRQPSKITVTIDDTPTTVDQGNSTEHASTHYMLHRSPPCQEIPRKYVCLFAAVILGYVVLTFVPLPH
jgi:hypothetical protein